MKKVQIISYSDFSQNILVGVMGGIVWIGSVVFIMLIIGVLKVAEILCFPVVYIKWKVNSALTSHPLPERYKI